MAAASGSALELVAAAENAGMFAEAVGIVTEVELPGLRPWLVCLL